MLTQVMKKPTSKFGVGIVKSVRFPELKQNVPGVGKYNHKTFIAQLDSKCSSTRETLNSSIRDKNFAINNLKQKSYFYSPAVYSLNYAMGRHVANDNSFALEKSDWLKLRDAENADQLANLKELIGKNDLFTDKKACRRMAYLSLYYPLRG
ncbi:hypothetical protein BC833DRAFT_608378 [Globomyces pollinis-pini]|nr:hypothetical protein BC833DRAFT_608378 [Globomyces pollinis-pini]